jgi:hypothetical protein
LGKSVMIFCVAESMQGTWAVYFDFFKSSCVTHVGVFCGDSGGRRRNLLHRASGSDAFASLIRPVIGHPIIDFNMHSLFSLTLPGNRAIVPSTRSNCNSPGSEFLLFPLAKSRRIWAKESEQHVQFSFSGCYCAPFRSNTGSGEIHPWQNLEG